MLATTLIIMLKNRTLMDWNNGVEYSKWDLMKII